MTAVVPIRPILPPAATPAARPNAATPPPVGHADVAAQILRRLLRGLVGTPELQHHDASGFVRIGAPLPRRPMAPPSGWPLRAVSPLPARLEQRLGRQQLHFDRQSVGFRPDVPEAFYALWLDAEREHSCAYFESPRDTLDQAQRNKLAHVCRKLRLQPGDRLLDLGCGWGGLICWAARNHGVKAHGITLDPTQYSHAKQRIAAEHLQSRVTVELREHRDLRGEAVYDKVVSVGMFEHAGRANIPAVLATVRRLLRPGGLFLNQGITHDGQRWDRTVITEFAHRFVFPDAEFDSISNIQRKLERTGFEIQDVEALRHHYALTLRHWVDRLEAHRAAAEREIGEPAYRIWHLYMAACALAFEAGSTGLYQVLAVRRGAESALPLTRHDLYVPRVLPRPQEIRVA